MRFVKQVVWTHSDDRYHIVAREKGGFATLTVFPQNGKYELTLDAIRELHKDLEDVIAVMTGEKQ